VGIGQSDKINAPGTGLGNLAVDAIFCQDIYCQEIIEIRDWRDKEKILSRRHVIPHIF
jgi:hypothetical protein